MQPGLLRQSPYRQQITFLALAGYLCAVWGFPVSTPLVKSDGRPFPCQDHQCGCSSADDCWHSCCCYTASEKLAWAKKHGVEVPAQHATHLHAAAKGESTCCHSDAKRGCCASAKNAAPSCCSAAKPTPQAKQAPAGSTVKFVSAFAARKCRGLPTLWCSSGAVVPPPATIQWSHDWNVVEQLETVDRLPRGLSASPPVPPPKI